MKLHIVATGLALMFAPLALHAQDATQAKPLSSVPANVTDKATNPPQVVPVPGTPATPTPPPGLRSDKPGRLDAQNRVPAYGYGAPGIAGRAYPMQPYSYVTPIHPLCVGCQGLSFPPPYPNFQPPCLPCMPFQGLVPPPPGPGGQQGVSFQFHQYTRSPRDFFMLDIPR